MKIKTALHLSAAIFDQERRRASRTLLPLVAAVLLPLAATAQTITSAVPGYFNFQGKVVTAGGALLGASPNPVNRLVIFRIWDHGSNAANGNLVYSEQQTVTITDGEFSVLIGQGAAVAGIPLGFSETTKGPPSLTIGNTGVFGGATRFLGITVDDGTSTADPEISPRQQLVTSAYAFRAKYAESVGANGVNTLTTLDNGNVGIGTASPGVRLEVNGTLRAGGVGTPTAALSLLANSATTQAMSIGYSNAIGTFSSDAVAGDTVVRTENGGKLLLQTGSGSSALAIAANNNIGIGTTNPGNVRLSILGSGATGAPANTGSTAVGNFRINDASRIAMDFGTLNVAPHYPAWIQVHDSAAQNTNYALSLQPNGGDVGIGTTAPNSKLNIVTAANNYGLTVGDGTREFGTFLSTGSNAVQIGSKSNHPLQFFTNGSAAQMTLTPAGTVGIGTTNPTRAVLEVTGTYGSTSFGPYGGLASGGAFTGSGSSNHSSDLGIYASNSIMANVFRAFSDARIKKIEGRSDGAADLSVLNQIEITDYTFRDTALKGSRPQKKVIGQQVETVFPQAVTRSTDVVPDIYQMAVAKDGWIELKSDLKVGERVRLVAEKSDQVYEVLEVQPTRFRTAFAGAAVRVFVFGREVADFRSVDYEAIAMLNVSATQQIKREKDAEVAALQTENAGLRSQLAAQNQRLADLETQERVRDAKLAAIEKLLQSAQTAMARPTATNANGQD